MEGLELIAITDETLHVLHWDPWNSTWVILTISASLLISMVCKYMIINFITRYAPKNRPVNTLIVIDQVTQGLTSFLFALLDISSLASATPLYSYVGSAGCKLHWFANSVHNNNSIFGELSIAIYRLTAIKKPKIVKIRPVLKFASLSSVLMLSSTAIFWLWGIEYSGIALTMEFCHGYTSKMTQILKTYEGLTEAEATFSYSVRRVTFVWGQVVIVARLTCYLFIFLHIRQHNNKPEIKRMLPSKEVKQRNTKNIISIYGQLVIFALELILSIVMHLLLFSEHSFFPPGSYSCMLMIVTATVSVVRITLASPELRRFYF